MLDTLNKRNELDLGYEYSGEHTVKNIIEPVRVYRVSVEPGAAGKRIGEKKRVLGRRYLAAVVIVLVIGAAAFWIYYMRHTPVLNEPISPSETTLPLIERASIAVLPFSNLSGDPEQEYFSDGITNDLITAFSKFKELLVIASNTIFTYKGKAVNIERIGQTYQVQVSFGWTEFPIQVLQQAKDLALKALSLEESNAGAYTLLGLIYTFHVF